MEAIIETIISRFWVQAVVLGGIGVCTGFINTLAGGGSLLSVPTLLLLGIPASSTNATNRIPVLMQGLGASIKYIRSRALKFKDISQHLSAVIIGALVGSMISVDLPELLLKRILIAISLFVILSMIQEMRNKQGMFAGRFRRRQSRWGSYIIFTILGFYGGFIQIGYGLLVYPIMRYVFNHNHITSNAHKSATATVIASISIVVFSIIYRDRSLIYWSYGLLLAGGSVIGGYFGAKLTISKVGKSIIQYALIVVTVLSLVRIVV